MGSDGGQRLACVPPRWRRILLPMAERPLAGKVALVTGGSRGIGRACALKLAALGADVVINYSRSAEDAEAAARDAGEHGGRALAVQADMGDRKAILSLFGRLREEFGRLDVLVNSAARGLERPRGAVDSLPRHLKHTMDVNLFGPWFCAQEAVKLMTAGGAIVNLLSPGAQRYLPRYAPVAISKGALASLTTYLAVELAPRGIRVNGVASGLVDGSEGVRFQEYEHLSVQAPVVAAGPGAEDFENVLRDVTDGQGRHMGASCGCNMKLFCNTSGTSATATVLASQHGRYG